MRINLYKKKKQHGLQKKTKKRKKKKRRKTRRKRRGGKYKKPSTNFSAQSFIITPETSKLVIFPAWTKHSVEQSNSNTERISIAFNFVEPK